MRLVENLGVFLQAYAYDMNRIRRHLRIGYVVMIVSALFTLYLLQRSTILTVYPVMTGTLTFYYLFMIRNTFDSFDVAKVFPAVELFAYGVVLRLRRGSDPIVLLWDDVIQARVQYGTLKIIAHARNKTVRPTTNFRVTYVVDVEGLLARIQQLRDEHLQESQPFVTITDRVDFDKTD